jgi:hypothetical protein
MIVFDASTLILLAKAELLALFLDHYPAGAVILQAVEGECVVSQPGQIRSSFERGFSSVGLPLTVSKRPLWSIV